MLSQTFLNWKQAQKKANHCRKKIRKGEKENKRRKQFYFNHDRPNQGKQLLQVFHQLGIPLVFLKIFLTVNSLCDILLHCLYPLTANV